MSYSLGSIAFICLLFSQLFLEENTKTYEIGQKKQETTISEGKVKINLFKEGNSFFTIAIIVKRSHFTIRSIIK